MNVKMIAGVLLILLGAFVLYNHGIPYTKKENVMQIGTIKAEVQTKEVYEVHPAISGLVLVGGVALVVLGLRKKS